MKYEGEVERRAKFVARRLRDKAHLRYLNGHNRPVHERNDVHIMLNNVRRLFQLLMAFMLDACHAAELLG